MRKSNSNITEQEFGFYHWLTSRADTKLESDFYTVLPIINGYGKKHHLFSESLFEIRDSEHADKFWRITQNDKRFRFLNYGHISQILLLLEKYSQYLLENEETAASEASDTDQHITEQSQTENDPFVGKESSKEFDELKTENGNEFEESPSATSEAGARVHEDMKPGKSTSEEPVSMPVINKSFVIRTINGTEYGGDTPAEALVSFCEAMAAKYPNKVKELIGMKVLTTKATCQDRIELKNVQGYIDRDMKESTAMRYAKWLSDSCGDSDSPKTIMVPSSKSDDDNSTIKTENNPVDDLPQKPQAFTGTSQSPNAVSSSRAWSKHEVALLIEAYLKTTGKNGNLRTTAEDLSHVLRELAAKNGKAIDSTYRNVNGIIMQLSTVQYIFTNGRNGLSNASAQIRDMVSIYKNWPSDYQQILAEAHRLINEPTSEIYKLLPEKEFSLFRNELYRRKIQSVDQLRALDLWKFINRYGLYAISKRHEICNQISARLNPPINNVTAEQPVSTPTKQPEIVRETEPGNVSSKQSDIKTENPAVPQQPSVEKDIGTKFCLKTRKGFIYYGSCPAGALASFCESLARKYPSKIRSLVGQRYNGIGQIVLHPDQPHGKGIPLLDPPVFIDKNLVEIIAQHYGAWLCRMCGELDIPVSVSSSSELSKTGTSPSVASHRFVSNSAESQKPAVEKSAADAKPKHAELQKPASSSDVTAQKMPNRVIGSTAAFRDWLEKDFRSYMIRKRRLSKKSVSQYCQSIEAIEQFFMEYDLGISLIDIDAQRAEDIRRQLTDIPVFVEWNKKAHYQYSAALVHYIEFLRSARPSTHMDTSQKAESIREIVINILSETNRSMTTSEIYREIVRRNLYIFNSNNPLLIVDHAIRKSCEGVKTTPHCKVDDFGRTFDEKGISHYYLLSNGNPEASKTTREIVRGKPIPESDSHWNEILSKYFPDGYILNDFLSQLQAKTYWQEEFGSECSLDEEAIDEAMQSVGTVRDGRVFIRSEEESSLIDDICTEIKDILQEYTAVYVQCVYDRYQDKLAKYSIFTEKVMEQQLLEKSQHEFYRSNKAFVRPGHESYLTNDCRKVLRNHGGAMPVSEVQKILWFIPGDTVYHTLSVDKEAINIGNSVWMLAEHFPLTADDADVVGDVFDEYFISNDYLQAADILPLLEDKLPSIAADLNGFHFSAIFGILRLYLDNRFSFTKAIVAPKGAKMEFKDLFVKYAVEHNHFTYDELIAFAKEIKTPIYWGTLFTSGAVRISENEFVNQSEISFDIPATDKVLEDICPGDYIPIMAVSPALMMHLPVCGYQWNAYLLLNYVLSFSKIFKASYNSLGKGVFGAIVRKDCQAIGNYRQLIERVLTDDDTWNTVDDVLSILVERGFQATKDMSGIEKIMSQAKLNKLKGRG